MNVQQKERANTVWTNSTLAGSLVIVLVTTSLFFFVVLVGLVCAVAAGVSVLLR